ncbi:NAD(P)H-dependent oxidoreductase [Bacteroidota bacterium]
MEFKDIVMKRYAVKKFNGKKIPEEIFNELMEIIRYAPSSFNLQPWKIKVVTDQETKEKLLPFSWNQPQVTTCSHLLVFCADTNVTELINRLEKQTLEAGVLKEKVKAYVDIMKGSVESKSNEEKIIWAKNQLYLILGNAMNGATSLGLDSCPMEGFQPEEYSKILNIKEDLIPTVICPVGYTDDEPRPKLRFPLNEIVF